MKHSKRLIAGLVAYLAGSATVASLLLLHHGATILADGPLTYYSDREAKTGITPSDPASILACLRA
jgi:hypothetical protein